MQYVSNIIYDLFAKGAPCREFIESSPDAIVVISLEGKLLAYNDKARELFGYSIGQSGPQNVLEAYHNPEQRSEILSLLKERGVVQDFEAELLTASSEKILTSVNVSSSAFGGQHVNIATIKDISARKYAEEMLKKSEEKFHNLFEASSDSILILDKDGLIVDCNQTTVNFFKQKKLDLIGLSYFDFFPDVQPGGKLSHEIYTENAALVFGGARKRLLWQIQLKDGKLIECSVSLKCIDVDSEQFIMCVVRDHSEDQKMRARLRIDEIRFEALSTLSKMSDASLTSIYDYALEAAVRVTESTIGYIYFVSDNETKLTIYAWSHNVMPQCAVEQIPETYNIKDIGIWGDAIRLRKPTISNDYENCSERKGIPDGHVPIKRHMNIPVFDEGKIVILAGVGNKASDYVDEDVRQITLLMEGMWNVVCRKQADDALHEAYTDMEEKVFDRTEKLSLALSNLEHKNSEIEHEMEYRREVESQLKASAGRLSLATRSGGIGVWEWDLVSGALAWDDRMREIYRCNLNDFEGIYEAWQTRVHPADLAGAEMALSDAVESEGLFDWEFRIIWPDGEIRHIKASALPIFDETDTKIKSMIGINLDVTERRRLEGRLRRFERIISVTPDMVSLVNQKYEYVMVNDSYVESFGKPHEFFVGKHISMVTGQDFFDHHSKEFIDAAFAGETQVLEEWLDVPLLGQRFLSITYQRVDSGSDEEQFIAIAAHDITGMKAAEEDREHIFEVSLDMLFVAKLNGHFLELNPAWNTTLGWNEEDLKHRKWLDFVHPEDMLRSLDLLDNLSSGKIVRNFENRYQCKDGSWRWISWSLHSDTDQGKLTGVARDVTVQKKMVDDLRRMASTDVLTGANNRRFFLDRAHQEIDRFKRYGGNLCLLMLDIDHFKNINDTFGHDVGDTVLKELVHCSIETLRQSDIFGRIGGEEFAALLVQGDIESAISVAERLRISLSKLEIVAGEDLVKFTVSIGLAWIDATNASVQQAMKQADRCLYKAKAQGRNRVISRC